MFANFLFLERKNGRAQAVSLLDREFFELFAKSDTRQAPLVTSDGIARYAKGGYLLTMLRQGAGEQALLDQLRSFLCQVQANPPQDSQALESIFIQCLQPIVPAPHGKFLEQWIHSTAGYDPAITRLTETEVGGRRFVAIDLSQRGRIRFTVPVRVNCAGGQQVDADWDGLDESAQLTVEVPGQVLSAELDPEHLQLDWDRSNNRLQPGREFRADPASTRFQGWTSFTRADGLPDQDICHLFMGRDGVLRAAVQSFSAIADGRWAIGEFKDQGWNCYSPRVPAVHMVNSMAQTTDGRLWFGAHNRLAAVRGDDSQETVVSEIRIGEASEPECSGQTRR